MAKQDYIRYDGYGLFVDGIQAERITSVSINLDKGTEDILQLSDSGIVQKISQTPDVSITVEANFTGGTDLLRLMTEKVINLAHVANGYELNSGDARYDTSDGYLRFDRIKADSANPAYGWPTHTDMLNSYVEITVPIRDGDTGIGRTLHIHRAALTGYSVSLDVNGNATESFNLSASNRHWFLNAWKDVRPHILVDDEIEDTAAADGSDPNSQQFNIAMAGSHSADGHELIGLFVGRNTAFSNNTDDWTFHDIDVINVGQNQWTVSNKDVSDPNTNWANPFIDDQNDPNRPKVVAMIIPTGGQTYAGSDPGNWGFELTHSAGSLGAAARQYADVYFWNSQKTGMTTSTAEGRLLRLQSFNIDVSPETEDKLQIGDKEAFAVFRKTPVNVTGSLSLLASDLEFQAIAASTSGGAAGPNMMTIDMMNSYNNLLVNFYQDEQKTVLLSKVAVYNVTISNESDSISVGGEGAEEFSFEADNFIFTGTGVNPSGV